MLVAWLFLIAVASTQAEVDSFSSSRTFCGRKLADAMAMYCYVQKEVEKREAPTKVETNMIPNDAVAAVVTAAPWLAKARALSQKEVRDKQALVDKCCIEPCHFEELISYC